MSEIILPTIAHATVSLTPYNRVEIVMHNGWVFYDTEDYINLTDEKGNPRDPYPEEICYARYGVYAPDTDFDNRIIVVAEADVPADQIFSDNNAEVMSMRRNK